MDTGYAEDSQQWLDMRNEKRSAALDHIQAGKGVGYPNEKWPQRESLDAAERRAREAYFSGVHVPVSDEVNRVNTAPQNPKHVRALKDGKAPLEALIGGKVDAEEAWVLAHGGAKYGVRNWLLDPILLKTYVGAIRRHLNAWADGEDLDPDSGKSHLAHIRACCAVALDAMNHGTAVDNRLEMESKSQ
jgi:hypothetical protein